VYDEATRLKRRHGVLRKTRLQPSTVATLGTTEMFHVQSCEPLYINAGEEKKGREREKEEGREGKGREFIPVGMELLITLS
jgi:hypothetical protein